MIVDFSGNVISAVVKNSAKFAKGNPFRGKGGSFILIFRYFIVSGLKRG